MKEISVIIVEDDANSIKRLCDDLASFPEVEVKATVNSPENAPDIIIRKQPDMLFHDVDMPGMSGIELLKQIQPRLRPDVKVVFYTAHDKYLLEALRVSAFDYLQKPYMFDELAAIMDRYRSCVSKNDESSQQLHLPLLIPENTFAIQTISGLMLLHYEKILLFEYHKVQRCWQMMHIENHKLYKLKMSTKAKDLLALNKAFVQINQDCIINLHYLLSIENRSLRCNFYEPHHLIERTASQRYFKKIKELIEHIRI